MLERMTRYVRLKRFCEMTGWTPDAVQKMIQRCVWIEGRQFRRVDAGLLIDLQGYEKWVEMQ